MLFTFLLLCLLSRSFFGPLAARPGALLKRKQWRLLYQTFKRKKVTKKISIKIHDNFIEILVSNLYQNLSQGLKKSLSAPDTGFLHSFLTQGSIIWTHDNTRFAQKLVLYSKWVLKVPWIVVLNLFDYLSESSEKFSEYFEYSLLVSALIGWATRKRPLRALRSFENRPPRLPRLMNHKRHRKKRVFAGLVLFWIFGYSLLKSEYSPKFSASIIVSSNYRTLIGDRIQRL